MRLSAAMKRIGIGLLVGMSLVGARYLWLEGQAVRDDWRFLRASRLQYQRNLADQRARQAAAPPAAGQPAEAPK